jgi:phosphatidylglycerol:prolipoprotein diacylglycerol transferase
MIPYIEPPVFEIGAWSISGFRILVAMAVLSGYVVALQRVKQSDLPRNDVANFIIWVVIFAFIGSHLFAMLAYHPEAVWKDPLALLNFFGAMSSFGGMVGGIIGGALFLRWHDQLCVNRLLKHLDIIAYAFPFGWVFGRTGCSVAHDHPGIASTHWLAVRFPGGPRFDLGLLELICTMLIVLIFFLLRKRQWPSGFFVALFLILYNPARFFLDTLRVADARYLGWTPGQYMAVLMTLSGLALMGYVLRSRSHHELLR